MKRWLWILSILVLLALFFPKLASTPVGKKVIIGIVETKTHATIEMNSIHLSWFGPQSFEGVRFKSPEVDGSWSQLTAKMPLWKLSKLQGEFTLSDGNFSFHSPHFGEAEVANVQATIQGHQFTANGSTRQGNSTGSFSIQGNAEKFPTDFSLQGNLSSVPSIVLDNVLKAKGLIAEALGPSFNLNGSAVSQAGAGSLDCTLSSPNCQTEVHGDFDGKAMRLRKPVTASFKLTPALSALLTKDINPLFLTGVQARDRIVLRISPQDFKLPYAPFELKQLTIGQGSLDMGRVIVQNGPTLRSLIGLLQSNWLNDTREMNAWFTPVDFSIRNGIVSTGRLDALLADSIHICTWGNIYLISDQIEMYLGLPADTLARSFGLRGFHPDYVLKVPIRGTTKKPELITGPATAQIAAMVASQNIPIPKAGKVLGNIFGIVSQLKSDNDVPPAKRPFPWER